MIGSVPTDSWNPDAYAVFSAQRRQPFDDLMAACRRVDGGSIVDLGCGSGELTQELHLGLGASETIGVDRSAAMLEGARGQSAIDGLTFVNADITTWSVPRSDLVFANASLQWIDDHPTLLRRLAQSVAPGGELAFQVPANFSHPSHRVAVMTAAESPFREALGAQAPASRGDTVLSPSAYAELLYELGAREPKVWLRVYPHLMASPDAVVAWVSGTLLTSYRDVLDEEMYGAFVERYRVKLREVLGDRRPYFYAFARILALGQLG
jgi:trans-aconitate 2-methyltransferase